MKEEHKRMLETKPAMRDAYFLSPIVHCILEMDGTLEECVAALVKENVKLKKTIEKAFAEGVGMKIL